MVWHDNGTVTYKNLRWYEFVPEKSRGMENDTIISVNLPFVVCNLIRIKEVLEMARCSSLGRCLLLVDMRVDSLCPLSLDVKFLLNVLNRAC